MTKMIRSAAAFAAVVLLTGAMSFAESGDAIYKANCQSCHGATGTPNPGIAKMMGVKPASDPSYKTVSAADMSAAVKNGKGKMKPFAGKLTDAQITAAVTFFRTLK